MNAQPKITKVSWPVRGIDGTVHKRIAVVRPWEAPAEDKIDPVTGEPLHWEPEHVRAYVRDAMDILKRMPMPRGGMPAGQRSGMPDVVREVMESYGYDEARAIARPSALEISQLDRVLAWLWWISDDRQVRIVTAAGFGLNYRSIGRMVRLHWEQARREERKALQRIAGRLNEGWERRT